MTLFNKVADAERAHLQRQILGINTLREITQTFERDVVKSLEKGISDPIFNLLQGTKQSFGDILKVFTTGIDRAIANAIGSGVLSFIGGGAKGGIGGIFDSIKNAFTGHSDTSTAINSASHRSELKMDAMNTLLAKIAACSCMTAGNTNALASNIGRGGRGPLTLEGTITPASVGALGKIGAIAGAVGSLASLGLGFSGGGASSGGGVPANAGISYGGGGVEGNASGGYVRPYAGGGEVSIGAQPGEFVVRKAVASQNTDFLREFNVHGNAKAASGGGGSVFLIKANDAKSFSDMLATPSGRAQIEMAVMRAIAGNGSLRQVIKNFT